MSLCASPVLQFNGLNTASATTTTATTTPNEQQSDDAPTRAVSTADSLAPANARQLQNVLSKTHRAIIVRFIVQNKEKDGQKGLFARTVRAFPQLFRGAVKPNIQRASRYGRDRERILPRHKKHSKGNGHYFVRATKMGLKKHLTKAAPVRGRKQSAWCLALGTALIEQFDIFRKAGVKINARLLRVMAIQLIKTTSTGPFASSQRDPHTKKPIIEHTSVRWVQHFMQKNNIVSRSQTGKLLVPPAKRELIEREVAFHIGELSRELNSGLLKEDDEYNTDEIHYVIDTHDHKTLARRGDQDVKYADVVSGDEGMTVMVLLHGGRDFTICNPFIIFKNENRSHPIRGVPDDVPRVSHRSGPKAWMEKQVFVEWIKEKRALPKLPHGRKKVLFMDSCSGHALSVEAKEALKGNNTERRFFPANATDLVQPADIHYSESENRLAF